MATLRDPLFGLDNAPTGDWAAAEIEAARPNSLRGGWGAGRIGTERNALTIDEAAARANGDIQRADSLRAQNEALGQAQARVAPTIGRVEDINGVGDALSWAAGQVGQGAASMVEPLAAATALGGIGRVAGMLPGAAGKVGRAIGTVGAPLTAYGINQRQMAGEFANTAMADPELMARTSPQELYNTANIVGGVAGLADTVLPTVIGRQLTGAGLRQGIGSMGFGAKTALGMAGEGMTEVGQGEVSRYAQGVLNPNRDTSGDVMDRVNEGLGGAVGAGPFTAAGAAADAGYRRAGVTADQIGAKTGDMIDMAKERYDGSALQQGVDKVVAAGKQKAGDLIDMARGEDGKIDLAKLAGDVRDGVEQTVEKYKVSAEERDILNGEVPPELADDPAKYTPWIQENDEKRTQLVAERLNDMLEADPKAEELFDRIQNAADPVVQAQAIEEGAKYILENNELEQLATRGQRAAAAFGELASKGATALGKGAVAAGKAAVGFGKAVFDGAAAEARKKNAQGAGGVDSYEAWKARRDEMRGGALPIEDQVERHRAGNRALDIEAIKNDPATAAAKLRSRRRAELFGEILEAEARSARAVFATRADPAVEDAFGLITRHAGYELADIAESWGMKGPKQQGGFSLNAGTRQTPVLTMALDRIANSLRIALRDRAGPVLDQLQAQTDAGAAPLFDYVRERIASTGTPAGRKAMEAVRTNVANELMMLVPDARRAEIMRSEAAGGKLSRTWLLESVEALANGHESPKFRAALDEAFGQQAVSEMVDRLNIAGVAAPKLMKGTVNDGGVQGDAGVNDDGEYEAEQASDFDKRQAEKTVAKGSGPKVYGFYRTGEQSLRGSTDRRDPFAPLEKTSKGATPTRPALFKADTALFDGTNALDKKIADMEAQLKEVGGHSVGKQSAYDVMKELGFQPGKVLSVYRDYLVQDAEKKDLDPAEKSALLDKAARVAAAVLDKVAQSGGQRRGFRTLAIERKQLMADAKTYFKERYVAVAEKLSDAVPNRIELTELLNMGRAGAKAVEYARGQGDMQYQVLDEANLITFQSDLLRNKDRGLHIKADTLVGWVRAQRERTETRTEDDDKSNRTKNEAYLDDLMEGIAAVTDSGLVDEKMPTRINAKGEYESFAKDIPPNLRLETMTYGQFKFAQEQRVKKRMGKELEDPTGGEYQERVAREQGRDFFTADPLEGTEREPVISRGQGQSMTAEEEAQFAALETAKERREFLKSLGLKQSGERFGDARAADAKTSGDNATPLDFFPKQKSEAVPDEFADQQFRTVKKAVDVATDPEPKMSAMAKAPGRGAEIVGALHKDFAAGVAMIESRLRSAARPESFADPKARETSAVGGQHYVMPLAHALNADTISKLDLGPAEAKQLVALRAQTAQAILLADKLSDAQKVALTKAMAPAASAGKVNLANYAALLQKAAAGAIQIAPQPAALLQKAAENALAAEAGAGRVDTAKAVDPVFQEAVARFMHSRLNEKAGGLGTYTPEQLRATNWESFSRSRGYTETEIEEHRKTGDAMNSAVGKYGGEARLEVIAVANRALRARGYLEPQLGPDVSAAKIQSVERNNSRLKRLMLKEAATPKTTPTTSATGQLAKTLQARLEYLTNPPDDYTTAKAREIEAWAKRQLERVNEAIKGAEEGSERYDALDEARSTARLLVKKAASVLEGDASLAEFEGTAAPEVAAAGAPKSRQQPAGADWSDTGGRKLNAQEPGGQDGQRAKLITRLADARRGAFSAARPDGIHRDASREVSFGPVRGAEEVFLLDQDYSHTFIIPRELTKAAQQKLSEYPADRAADVLSIFAVQHAAYHRGTGEFTTFGPDPRGPAGRLLAQLDALSDTGQRFRNGVPVTRVEGVTDRQLAAFLGDALAYTKQVLGVSSLPITWRRQTGGNIGKEGEGIFNAQSSGGNSRVATQAEMDEAKAYVRKVLGPQIKVEFKDITGYSGEWLDAEQAIEISTTAAAGALSTAYHEALHGFFSKFVKSDPRVLDTLKSLAENEKILQRVAALLAGHPAALDQLKSGEERLAYIYQFWAAGKLDLPIGKPRTLLQKVRKFFRRVLGLVRDSERAVALFEAFHGGQLAEPSAAGKVIAKVLDEGTGVLKARRKLDGLTQWLAAKTMPAETVLATSESKAAQALAKEFFTNPGDEDAGGEAEGYLNARRRVAARYNNTFAQAVNGLTDRDMTEVAKYLQAEAELSDIPYAPHREAVAKIRGLLQRFYKYMSDERGMNIDHAGDKYYPRVWNTALLHEKKDQFLTMLTTHYDTQLEQGAQGSKGKLSKEQVAERIWRALIDREGVNDKLDAQRQDGVLAPFFASKENRTLSWLEGEHAEPFLEKNLVATLSRYFHQGVRAAEYTERFGENGELLEARLREIMGELNELSVKKMQRKEFKDDAARAKWVNRQYRDIAEAVGAMEGTLGKDISPAWRKANSWMTVYQNVRLLPLSLFASFVDPLGMVARGATMKEAYDSFLRGMKEVFANWGDMFREEPKERQADKWEKLAEHIGAVDAALFAHHVSDEYSSVYMERGAKKINDTMFKLNGMEAWNRGMRVAGVKNAVAFIERHAAGADKIHSARWLKELGLDPSNIPLDDDGQLITDKNVLMAVKGIGKSQAEREIDAVHYAINRWVEGAVLTPNAAQRPAWGSDPHYSMFFHLKQFSYSFHQTILKRAVNEMNHGNLAPMGAFAWYIPTMIAADITKGLIQGGGELPAYMKGYDAGDWVMHGVQRAGVLGAAQLGVDASGDMFSLAGPGAEQMIDAMREPLSDTVIKALPAHGLFAQALK